MLSIIGRACEAGGWTLREGEVFVPLPGRRHQMLHIHRYDEAGEALIRVHTNIAPANMLNELRMSAALRLNATMRHGAFAVLDDELVIADTFQAHHSTAEEVRRSMTYMAARADDYERAILHADDR